MIDLAWTGGYDSTFRLLQILENGDNVTPHYIGGWIDGRENTGSEIETMRALHADLSTRYPGQLKPIKYVWEWPVDAMTERAFQSLNRDLTLSHAIGNQYLVLAMYALESDIRLEVCAEPGGRMWRYLKNWKRPEHADALPNLAFPVLNTTKEDMMAWAESLGLDRYLVATHTCWRPPTPGTACGQCEMCRRRIAFFDPIEPIPYDVEVSICVPAALGLAKAEATVRSAVESIRTMDIGRERSIEVVWAGNLNKQRKAKLEKICSVVHVDAGAGELSRCRNAAAAAATGHIHVHLLPGIAFRGDALAMGVIRALLHKFWTPVPVNKGQGGTPFESTAAIPSGRGPWPLVAAPWWAYRRVGPWVDVEHVDLNYAKKAKEKGIAIERHVEVGITFPEQS